MTEFMSVVTETEDPRCLLIHGFEGDPIAGACQAPKAVTLQTGGYDDLGATK